MSNGNKVKSAVIFIAVVGAVLTLWLRPQMVQFWEFTEADVVRLFTRLILIALFLERALEVFISGWRREDEEQIERHLNEAERAQLAQNAGAARIALVEFKAETRRLAFLVALAFGIAISALGVRSLEFLAEPQAFSGLPSLQKNLFTLLDVLLTGALLSGGADGLHKVLSVFLDYMDRTRNRLRARP